MVRVDRRAPPEGPLGDPGSRHAHPCLRRGLGSLAGAGGAELASLATVTCPPNADVAPVHDRMPVILAPADWPVWLGEATGDAAALMRPLAEGALVVERVAA